MIYTLTMNPAIDMNLTGEGIRPNQVNRTRNTVYSPNGKGINVSLTLRHFGCASGVLGFFGGFTGTYIIEALKKRRVMSQPIWVEDTTRINIFVNDGRDEFKFVNRGAYVSEEKQTEFLALLSALEDCSHLVISGSLPQGIAPAYYDRILTLCMKKKIEVILDVSSPKLKDLLAYGPLLIKPNDEEVQAIFGVALKTESEALKLLQYLKALGARNVLLTLGEKGAYFSDGRTVFYSSAQPVQLVSSACAGDAALGAFLSEWLDKGDVETALKKSAATGANVAESDALGDFSKVFDYMKHIVVRKAWDLK